MCTYSMCAVAQTIAAVERNDVTPRCSDAQIHPVSAAGLDLILSSICMLTDRSVTSILYTYH